MRDQKRMDFSDYIFDVDAERGLSEEQARKLKYVGLANTAVKPPSKSIKKIIATNSLTYFNFVFLLLGIIRKT